MHPVLSVLCTCVCTCTVYIPFDSVLHVTFDCNDKLKMNCLNIHELPGNLEVSILKSLIPCNLHFVEPNHCYNGKSSDMTNQPKQVRKKRLSSTVLCYGCFGCFGCFGCLILNSRRFSDVILNNEFLQLDYIIAPQQSIHCKYFGL